ncbi:MAG: aminotransferase class I/II-fold pyridoxal phosphate-dependent enzyme [Longimicrobiales bacterium]|nr:aminotransferase class I/II-fold pyridoxal phosphate-dependent enzyme [Longimicrobiales bacterium]
MTIEPFRLERFFAAHEFSTPHLLSVSDCESMTVAELLALEPGARQALERVWLGYTESRGGEALRGALAAAHPGLGPDDFLVHAGGVEVLLTVALASLEPGDHAVVQAPCYQAARSAPALAGARVSLWSGDVDRGWKPDLDALPTLLDRPRTRLLVVNTPHNPTGYHFTLDELRRILAAAESRGVRVLVDEAYRGAEYRDEDRLPPAATLSPTAGALGLLSKGFGLPGLRLGWLASRDHAFLDRVARVKDYTTICAPAPVEFLGALALRHREPILARSRGLLNGNLAALAAFMDRHRDRFRWMPPRAGSVCLPLLRDGDAEAFCARAREQAGVLLAPGPLFDGERAAFRIGFGRAGFREGLAVLEDGLARG